MYLAVEPDGSGLRVDMIGAEPDAAAKAAIATAARIDPNAPPATAPLTCTGAWSTGAKRAVKNWGSSWTGDIICAGGATTGWNRGRVIDDSVSYPGHTGGFYIEARVAGRWR